MMMMVMMMIRIYGFPRNREWQMLAKKHNKRIAFFLGLSMPDVAPLQEKQPTQLPKGVLLKPGSILQD
jgi:hypothetical protein